MSKLVVIGGGYTGYVAAITADSKWQRCHSY